jgi:histidinol dehydrogenase
MRIIDTAVLSDVEIRKLLVKPAFDETPLPAAVRAGIREKFGRDLSARQVAEEIVAAVRAEGDAALFRYTRLLDGADLNEQSVEVREEEFAQAAREADPRVLAALDKAIANVRRFHEEQLPRTWLTERAPSSWLGQRVTPLERVGLYVPGGTAAYPSSVVMNAVPAAAAGVKDVIMCVPPSPDGAVNPYVLLAARRTGVRRVFKIGGAQAVAALAFGTESVPRVDKITGPGNIFVTLAKKAVYGYCGIDMLAGPSELFIIAGAEARAEWLAADLLSQAEHDPLATVTLATDSRELAEKVASAAERRLLALPRRKIAERALTDRGLILLTPTLARAAELANLSAPEHLEIAVREPFSFLPLIKHAGAIFLGQYSPEPLGDYFAGPNHVLPTGGSARFYSVLNVETFMKKTSIIAYSKEALLDAADDVALLAEAEGLAAHAEALKVRMNDDE